MAIIRDKITALVCKSKGFSSNQNTVSCYFLIITCINICDYTIVHRTGSNIWSMSRTIQDITCKYITCIFSIKYSTYFVEFPSGGL